MNGYCKVVIAGNVARDPEMKYLPSGSAISSFDMAINRKWKQDGENKEEVSFVPITAFGKTAELIGQYVKKGNPLLIDGRLKQETWTDKQTQQKRSKLGVVVESVTFLGSGSREDGSSAPTKPVKTFASPPPISTPQPAVEDDDIPF